MNTRFLRVLVCSLIVLVITPPILSAADAERAVAQKQVSVSMSSRIGHSCFKYLIFGTDDLIQLPQPKPADCGGRLIYTEDKWQCATEDQCTTSQTPTLCGEQIRNMVLDSTDCAASMFPASGNVVKRGILIFGDRAGRHP